MKFQGATGRGETPESGACQPSGPSAAGLVDEAEQRVPREESADWSTFTRLMGAFVWFSGGKWGMLMGCVSLP